MAIIACKICLIGSFGVGKTSLIRQFVDRQFSDQYLSTVGVKISKKGLDVVDGEQTKSLQLLIWDIEGQTKFKPVVSSYLQGAKGAIIVGDITRRETLEQLTGHIQEFLSVNPESFITIALNKADLVELNLLEKLIQQYTLSQQEKVVTTIATSAKTGANVDQAFQQLAIKLIQ